MKGLILALLTSVAMSFAAEQCNDGTKNMQIPLGSCYNDGYVCQISSEASGAVRFYLGKTSNCQTFETTNFTTYPYRDDGTLNTTIPENTLRPLIVEDPMENVGALGVAVNTAFIINAFNEKLKVRIIYHRSGNIADINSVRLQGITEIP
ncbi:MAG: hypothetical protein HUK21_09725 [Fibrobacteraceae bacterium]|nr:hypothetical protein [Fibrobacteraceae bacterium]